MKQTAGILLYRFRNQLPEIFLCHPGGPFYTKKDLGVWTIPKGEFEPGEEAIAAAKREFEEETGQPVRGKMEALDPVKYKDGRKIVYAWAVEGDIDASSIKSNNFSIEWPPKSGKFIEAPEIDRGEWFDPELARKKILPSLLPLVDDLLGKLPK